MLLFYLGVEVGISMGCIYVWGFVGVEGLLIIRWVMIGQGYIVVDFVEGGLFKYFYEIFLIEDVFQDFIDEEMIFDNGESEVIQK